ncbi:DUF2256 domain-containing protein [Ferrithrix thermotolerans]|uniref:DUF2256 domain-containing protein n=1 Tax=Ferrithrix thermotolerans TaxID=209649 RepID=UPI0009334B55
MMSDFKGNKAHLPRKTCKVCGREMVYRKRWRDTWNEVLYCSERCRRDRRKGL